MKKFFLVSVSILLTLLALFGVWFGVSYAKNGLAKQFYDKLFNVEEPTEEPEEPENYAYQIVVTKSEGVEVPTTGMMKNVKVGDKLGGKWYAVDMERFNLEMTAGDLSFTNGVGGETYAYVNDYFGIEVFTNLENGFLFYLPETFDGSYYVGYDAVNEVEVNETLNLTWTAETLIDTVSEGVYVIEQFDGALAFPYDISAYNLDVTIPEGIEVPQTGTLRKVEIGESFGGKWYAVDVNQIKKEGITSNFIKAGDAIIRGFTIDVGIDSFVAINSYSLIEGKTVNGVTMFYIPESANIKRIVGYDAYSGVLINSIRKLSWNSETVIENACSFVYVVEESENTLAYPYATDEDYCAYKLDVSIPEGVEVPATGTLRKAEVGEYLGGKWYAVDIERRKTEKITNSFISAHGMNFTLYNGCNEIDTLVCMNTYSGVECVTVGNVTMFYLPESINVVRNVGYDRHSSKMINSTRRFSWNATTDITAIGDYVYVVEAGDGELKFPVVETEESVDYSQINFVRIESNSINLTSGEVAELNVYAYLNSGEQTLLADKLEYLGCFFPESGYTTLEVYNASTDEVIHDIAIKYEIFSKMCTLEVIVENGKIVIEANYVKEYSDESYRATLPENSIVVLEFDVKGETILETRYVEISLN